MNDHSAAVGKIDRKRVSVATDLACLYWEAKLGAGRADIEAAGDAVGEEPGAVAHWLGAAGKSHIRLSRPARCA
jgi:hypothetical protein